MLDFDQFPAFAGATSVDRLVALPKAKSFAPGRARND